MGGMPATKTTSTPPSSGSGEWTPERVERMRRQDQASSRIRRQLGQIVTGPDHWRRSLANVAASSTTVG